MLRVDLSALRDGPVEVAGSIEPGARIFGSSDFRVVEPVEVRGRLSDAGPGQYFFQGNITTRVRAACRRCLRDVAIGIDEELTVVFTEDSTTDDPAAYVIPNQAGEIEMDEMVREQIILAVPGYPECRTDCRGLCATCGKDLNEVLCDCQPEPDPRWAALDALKSHVTDKES
jgi:DUF177 domain-containing protein